MFRLFARLSSSKKGVAAIIALWLVIAGVMQVVSPALADVTTNDQEEFLPRGAESVRVIEILEEEFPSGSGTPAIIVLRDEGGLGEPDFAIVAQLDERLRSEDAPSAIANIVSITSTPQAREQLVSPDGQATTVIVTITGSPAEEQFSEAVGWIRDQVDETVSGTDLDGAVTGPAGIITDAVEVFSDIDFRITLVTIVLILVLLLIIYRAPLLALLPIVSVGIALVLAQSIAAQLADNFGLALNGQVTGILSVLMFGAGTDYTLFIVSRYREELRNQPDRWTAIWETMRNVGPAIASSAGTTIVAMLALILATSGSFNAAGPMLAMAIFVMLIGGLTLIPALAVVMGRAAFWPVNPYTSRAGPSRFWEAAGRFVTMRPGTILAVTVIVLLVFSAGVPTLQPSFSFIESFPEDTESRVGFELLQEHFPPGELAPTELVVDGQPGAMYENLEGLEQLAASLVQRDDVVRVSGPTRPQGEPLPMAPAALERAIANLPEAAKRGEMPPSELPSQQRQALQLYFAMQQFISPDASTARLEVVLTEDPYSESALDSIPLIRDQLIEVAQGTELASAEVLVGGPTAVETDSRAAINRDIVIVGPIVIVAIWIILAVLLRSLVAPTYLVGSVLLSFAAAFGLSTLVFQEVFGHSGVSYVNGVWIFIFLVALGADYNIYIMSRVREEVRRQELVAGTRYAISQTGGVITSAGIILAGAFSVLTTFPLRDLFQLGFAVMIGVLMDTFVVRTFLVPSILILLKEKNWWPWHR